MPVPDGRSWYKITVPEHAMGSAGFKINDAMVQRLQLWADLGTEAVAVFQTREPDEEGDFYFTPRAALLLTEIVIASGGVPCPQPSREGLALLAGPADGLTSLLGD